MTPARQTPVLAVCGSGGGFGEARVCSGSEDMPGVLLLPQESWLVLQGHIGLSFPCVQRLPQLLCPERTCRLQLPSLHLCARRGLNAPVNRYHSAGSQPMTAHTECNRWDYFKCLCYARNHILSMTSSHLKAPLCSQVEGKKCPSRLCCLCSLPSVPTPEQLCQLPGS